MCYDDESFGGHGPVQSADQAFAGMEVTDSNLSVATGNSEFRPEGQNKAPKKPLVKKSTTGTVTMNPDSEYTYQELLDADFTDQDMIDGGHATLAVVKKAPPVKKAPIKKAPVKSVPTTGTVIMNEDSEYTYEQLSGEFEWSDEEIVNAGYATPNFTNPQ